MTLHEMRDDLENRWRDINYAHHRRKEAESVCSTFVEFSLEQLAELDDSLRQSLIHLNRYVAVWDAKDRT